MSDVAPSPSLGLPAACPAPPGSADAGVPWHYGEPHAEQRRLVEGHGVVDLSHRGVVVVSGPDRLGWLHSLTTGRLEALPPGSSALALILDPHGHVEHELHVIEDGTRTWLTVEPGTASALTAYLESMRFLLRVEVADVSTTWAVLFAPGDRTHADRLAWEVPPDFAGGTPVDAGEPGAAARYVPSRPDVLVGRELLVPRAQLPDVMAELGPPAGTWALESLRVAAAVPRLQHETDHRTLPHEVGWVGPAVHLAKGCYRGQEAVARVHNLGRPPRRLVLLHLDGSAQALPAHGDRVVIAGRDVGWVATPARHYLLGPIATAVIRRGAPVDADAVVTTAQGPVAARPEVVVTPW